MSVYKLITAGTTTQTTGTVTDSSLTSLPSASQTAGTHGSGAPYTENRDIDTSGAKSPGTIAGITVGSVSGVGVVLFLIVMIARWCLRRRQTYGASHGNAVQKNEKSKGPIPAAHSAGSVGTASATVNTHDAASIRDAKRIDLRRLDGVVMDQHSPSAARFSFTRGSNKEVVAAEDIGVAATTGAQWKGGASPLTPRTPRYVDGPEDQRDYQQQQQPRPSTPTIVVHPPDNIAPHYGLGERAWHRRRLSMEYSVPPPPVEVVATVVDDRTALPSQQGYSVAGDGIEELEVSALTGEGPVVESPSWTWTLSSVEDEKTEEEA